MSQGILVTGASRGIGAAILDSLPASQPCVGTCRPSTLAAGGLDERARWIGVDFEQPHAPKSVVEKLAAIPELTKLRGLVLSAGIAQPENFASDPTALSSIQAHVAVNLVAPLALIHALIENGYLAQGASIVFVGSNLARRGLAGKVSYSASKAGLEGATRALAQELGPQGIRVNTVAPGLIETDMTQGLNAVAKEAYTKQVPLGRIGAAPDVAAVVGFFLSPASAYVTGQVLDVDGGWSA